MKKRLVVLLPLLVFAALTGLFALRLAQPPVQGYIQSPLIGKPLPALDIGDLPEGPFIINFFASWCAPCAVENPNLMALRDQGIPVIGIAFRDTPENIRAWLKRHGNPYTKVVYDASAPVTLGITGVPESFAVGSDRTILARFQGPLEDDRALKKFIGVLR